MWKIEEKRTYNCHNFFMQLPHNFHSWVQIEAIVCHICHPNIEALEAAVTKLWGLMQEVFISHLCGVF